MKILILHSSLFTFYFSLNCVSSCLICVNRFCFFTLPLQPETINSSDQYFNSYDQTNYKSPFTYLRPSPFGSDNACVAPEGPSC